MKFMIAGLGSIGRRHLRNLVALGEKDILLYRTGRGTLPDDELVGYPVESDLQAALAHRPQAVIVANPTALHLQVAIPAAEQGCHLLLEKPVSHNLEGLDQLQRVVARGGGQVLVGFQFRYHPGLQAVQALLHQGAVGRPLCARAHWGEYLPDWHPWEDYRQGYSARPDLGGGVVLTLSHPLDYLRGLFGDVQALWAFTSNQSDLNIPVEDTAEIGLRFENSMLATVHLDYVQRPPAHYLEIIAEQGTIRWDNDTGEVQWFNAKDNMWTSVPVSEGFERNQLFLSEMTHFLDIVHGKAQPVCTLDDGIRALELVLAAHASADKGRLVRWGANR
jgi:predicted dehydrogenase